jgi:para-aminobenzoate synthetase component 1
MSDFNFQKTSAQPRKNFSLCPEGVGFFSYDFGRDHIGIIGKQSTLTPSFDWRKYERSICWNEKTGEVSLKCPEKKKSVFWNDVQHMLKNPRPKNICIRDPLQEMYPKNIWREGFKKAKENIFSGEIYQINLTRQFSSYFSGDSRFLFLEILKRNPAPQATFFSGDCYEILSFSPELFLKFLDGNVFTEPIKGTRPRSSDPLDDEKEKENLLSSEKESAELLMITDLLRNDIRQTCKAGSIHVESSRNIQKNPSVWHTFSKISGERKEKYSPFDTLFSCLPGGSISGCPKRRACEIIEEIEPHSRGIFCGTFGTLDAFGNGSFSLLIRTLVRSGEKIYFQAGGGITSDSKESDEFEEIQQKGKVFFEKSSPL